MPSRCFNFIKKKVQCMCWKGPVHKGITCPLSTNQASVQPSAQPVSYLIREHSRKSETSLQTQAMTDFSNHWTLFPGLDVYTDAWHVPFFVCLLSDSITYKIHRFFFPEVVSSHCCIVICSIAISWFIFLIVISEMFICKNTVLSPVWGVYF